MKHIFRTILLMLLALPISFAVGQDVNPRASSITFTVTNLGIEIDGRFRTFSGSVHFDPAKPDESSFEMSIPVRSINTGNKMRDSHLREEEFFDVKTYPNITFASETVETSGDGFLLKGPLTIKGTEKQISIPFSYADGVFSGSFVINRHDYNVGNGGFLDTIGDNVTITVKCFLSNAE